MKPLIYGIFVWTIAILFYFYEFFLRVLPATISGEIIQDLSISAEQFAWIGSAYYIPYALMQTPVGILYDRYGVRFFLTLASAICTLGVFGFAFSDHFEGAIVSRFFIGLGSAFGFISLLVLALNWFPQKYFAFLAGLGQMLGAVGPLVAGAPVAFLMQAVDQNWHKIFFGIALFGIGLTLLILLFVRDRPAVSRDTIVFLSTPTQLFPKLKKLFRIFQVWMIMLYAATTYVSLPLLGAYWGTLYLEVRGFSKPVAAFMISMIWIGLAIGSPLAGRLSDRAKRRKPFLAAGAFLGIFVSLAILYIPSDNIYFLSACMLVLGLSAAGQSLSFAAMADSVPEELRATAIGANNTAIMLFAALLPPLITWLMEAEARGATHYQISEFQLGFLVMPIVFALSFLIALFGIQETYCREQHKIHQV